MPGRERAPPGALRTMSHYQPRLIDAALDDLMATLPAMALEGPKGVGKTESAQRRARSAFHLDVPAIQAIAQADPHQLLGGERPILLDEWQRVPAIWDAVRRAVDAGAHAGTFLLAGSASPAALPTHSGAGRIVSVRMRPMTLTERGVGVPSVSLRGMLTGCGDPIAGETDVTLADYVAEIVASGFPGIRRYTGRAHRLQLDGYLSRIIDVDFKEQGHRVRKPQELKRWMAAYAAATATTASYETIRDAATGGRGDKPARSTTQPYCDTLERLWIVDPVPAWLPSRNQLRRLAQPPKHHLADPALAARMLGLDEEALLTGRSASPVAPRDGSLLGNLFESLVTLCIRVLAQGAEARVKHLRQHSGRREIDLIIERGDQRVLAVEVKLSGVVDSEDCKNLLWLRDQVGDDLIDAMVVNTGPRAYRRPDGIAVVPAALLGL